MSVYGGIDQDAWEIFPFGTGYGNAFPDPWGTPRGPTNPVGGIQVIYRQLPAEIGGSLEPLPSPSMPSPVPQPTVDPLPMPTYGEPPNAPGPETTVPQDFSSLPQPVWSEIPPTMTNEPPAAPALDDDVSIWADLGEAFLGGLIGRVFNPTPDGTGGQPSSGYAPPYIALPGTGYAGGGFTTVPGDMPAPGTGTGGTRGYRWSVQLGKWVKRRRMNPTNVHALRRALRRAEGFIRIEKRVDKIVQRAARSAGGARRHGFVRSKRK